MSCVCEAGQHARVQVDSDPHSEDIFHHPVTYFGYLRERLPTVDTYEHSQVYFKYTEYNILQHRSPSIC